MSFTSNDFRHVMSRFATGITVVTTVAEEAICGLTVNAFCSVSLNPPLVLISIEKTTRMHAVLQQSKVYAINILTDKQQHLSELFAGHEVNYNEAFSGNKLHTGKTGSPMFDDTLASLDCRVVAEYPGGDHTIFLAEVLHLEYAGKETAGNDDQGALLYFQSRYRSISGASD